VQHEVCERASNVECDADHSCLVLDLRRSS
jgi:hypothetical protein